MPECSSRLLLLSENSDLFSATLPRHCRTKDELEMSRDKGAEKPFQNENTIVDRSRKYINQ